MPNRNAEFALYLAKNETTEGTDAAPGPTTNAIEIIENTDPSYDFAFRNEALGRVRGPTLMPGDPMSDAGKIFTQTRKAALRGTTGIPTTSNRPELDPWFNAAGYAPTFDATGGAEKVTYSPVDTGLISITEWYYRDGKVYKFNAVRGDLTFQFAVGGPVMVDFAATGKVGADADLSTPTNGVFSTVEWPIATDATTFTVDGFTAGIIRSWEHTMGNKVERRDGVKQTGGVVGWRIASRNPTFKVVLESELTATKDFNTLRDNKTPLAIAWLLGGTQYNRFDFTASRAIIRKVTESVDNGLAITTLEGILRGATPAVLAIR